MTFRDKNRSNSGCNQLAERRRRTCSVPTRKTRETIHAEKLFESVRKFKCEYKSKWNKENADGFVEVRQFQWTFWNDKVLEIQSENEKVFVFMNNRSTEYSPDTIEMCRKRIFSFYKMAEMYTNSIYCDIRQQAADKSEMTVLIGVDAIQKYRCSKLLRLWKIISWEHQRKASHRVPTNDAMHETEDLITRNVAEFLNVVYDLRKWSELEIWI